VGRFARRVLALLDQIVEAVKSGAIKVPCGGLRQDENGSITPSLRKSCPGHGHPHRRLRQYRYNKLKLGDIGGIPRVLDAGQCDSYSLAVIAFKLKRRSYDDINKLPIAFNAWYEQRP
jgi:hydroxylamine reductase